MRIIIKKKFFFFFVASNKNSKSLINFVPDTNAILWKIASAFDW